MSQQGRPVTILLAEDDDGHAELIERNLRRIGLGNDIVRLADGSEVLDYLAGYGAGAGRGPASPVLLLLDINMPEVDGVEVLTVIRASERLQRIPVIMLTTTDDPREIDRCYALGCNAYVTKPIDYEDFARTIRQMGLFLSLMAVPEMG